MSMEGIYLIHHGLGESLTHIVRVLRGLVGEGERKSGVGREYARGHVFPNTLVVLWVGCF